MNFSAVPGSPPQGLEVVKLIAGLAGKAKVMAKGKGPLLSNRAHGLPAPLPALPLRVQLRRTQGPCWEAAFTTALASDAAQLKTKGE